MQDIAGPERVRRTRGRSTNETSVYRIEFLSFAIRGVNGNTEGPTSGYLTICIQAHEGIAARRPGGIPILRGVCWPLIMLGQVSERGPPSEEHNGGDVRPCPRCGGERCQRTPAPTRPVPFPTGPWRRLWMA
jgi:hypothetical protein